MKKELKYFIVSKIDSAKDFILNNKFKIVAFIVALIVGLVVGIVSASKPVDAVFAFSAHWNSLYIFIEQGGFLQYLFSSLLLFIIITLSLILLSHIPFAHIFLFIASIVFGYFQGGCVVYIIRIYGIIALPFTIVYALLSLVGDILLFFAFCFVWKVTYEKRKFGCKYSLSKIILSLVTFLSIYFIAFFIKYFIMIIFSFFL